MPKELQSKSNPKNRPSRLGKGLSTLMAAPVSPPPSSTVASSDAGASPEPAAAPGFRWIGLDTIRANPTQPRRHFDETALGRLADSIKSEGLMQPVVLRPIESGYELVAGERRWRAAKIAGLKELPALVKELDDRRLAEWALIENLQREDLNPIERAEAFERLGGVYGLGHEEIASRVGLERSTVTNLLRLLKLIPPVREMVSRGTLSMGQSRALAGIEGPEDQLALAEQAVKEDWSVRQVEAAAKALRQGGAKPVEAAKRVRAAYLDDLERQIGEQLGTKVSIKTARKKGAGTLSIDFYSIDQFDELVAKLGVTTQ